MTAWRLIVRRSSLIVNSFFALVFLLTIVSYLLPANVFAQESTPAAQVVNPYSYTSPLSPQYTNIQAINLIHTLSCLAEGVSVIGQPCIEYSTQTGQPTITEGYSASGGALGSVGRLITNLYDNRPLSTTHYLAQVGQNLHIIPEAHAQVEGSGNNVLFPVLEIWKITRNIAYLAMIIIFIVIGFMIMFRQKINPQTVISAQAALPGLIVGLLLITFSYFLAALIVDLTFVGTSLAARTFEGTVIQKDKAKDLLSQGNIIALFGEIIDPPAQTITSWNIPAPKGSDAAKIISDTTTSTLKSLTQDSTFGGIIQNVSTLGGCLIGVNLAPDIKLSIPVIGGLQLDAGKLAAKAVSCGAGAGLARWLSGTDFAGGLIGLILYVVLIIALLISLFRLLFALLVCYIALMITTITGPFYFLISSIPGRTGIASGWFKTMFANILVFPAVFAAMILAAYTLGLNTDHIKVMGTGVDFKGGTVPLLGGFPSGFLKIALAYGILLITPAIPGAVKGAFGVKDSPFGGVAVGAAAAGFGVARTFGGRAVRPIQAEIQAYREAKLKEQSGQLPEGSARRPQGPIARLFSGTWGERNLTPER